MMPNTFHMEIATALSQAQTEEITTLAEACCAHDQIHLSYPLSDEDTTHYLCYTETGRLCAALAMTDFYEDYAGHEAPAAREAQEIAYAECIAFTLPEYRRHGCFSMLLEKAEGNREDCDILFMVSGECDDTQATLETLGAELESTELQMESKAPFLEDVTVVDVTQTTSDALKLLPTKSDADSTLWTLCRDTSQTILGSCQTTSVSDDCICLHHVAILPKFRGQGYGTHLMHLLLAQLATPHTAPLIVPQTSPRRIILQVAGDNTVAIALYKKTGFRITETLSCYLY